MLANLLILVLAGAFVWALAYLTGGGAERKQTMKRIERLSQRKSGAAKTPQDMSLRRKTIEHKGLLNWLSRPLPNFKRLAVKLERAGKTISPKQYALRRLIWCLVLVFVISVILKKSLLLGLAIGLIIGVWLPLKLLQFVIDKQNKAFLRLFPDGLDLIVRGLRSGLPVSESLVLVSQEVPDPVGGIFTTIANTMKLGVPLEKALQETAQHLDLTEFNFFTTSIVLQRETGATLSEILNNLSEVLRNRYLMRMKIKAMASEARASAYIIGALPFVVMLAVSVLTPGYLTPLWTDHTGQICSATAAGMMVFGMWIMRRMAQFEI